MKAPPKPRVQPDPPGRALYLAIVGGRGPVNLVLLAVSTSCIARRDASGCRWYPSPTPGWAYRRSTRAADTDRPDVRRGAGWCSLSGTAPRRPCAASASRHACGRRSSPHDATDRAAFALRQTDAQDATHRYVASAPAPIPASAAAGSTPTPGTARATALDARSAAHASDRSSFCARIADATERAGQKIYKDFPFCASAMLVAGLTASL